MATIYEELRRKLGREPTHNETVAEVKRIIRAGSDRALVERASKGQLPHQRKRSRRRK